MLMCGLLVKVCVPMSFEPETAAIKLQKLFVIKIGGRFLFLFNMLSNKYASMLFFLYTDDFRCDLKRFYSRFLIN